MRFQLGQDIIDFLRRKKKKVRTDIITEFYKKYTPPTNTYKNLIITQGFGHSGSGVIIDLLSEFDNATVLGGHDKNGGSPLSQDNNIPCFEVDFIRRYGGVFYLEAICSESTRSYRKYHIANFINLVEYYFQTNIPIYNDKFLQLSYDFVDKLVEKKIRVKDPMAGNLAFCYEVAPRNDYKNLMSPYLASWIDMGGGARQSLCLLCQRYDTHGI